MTVPPDVWEQVRSRANLACEYCGVTERDTGGLLTVDHYRPTIQEGTDALDNLLYCCYRCNLYKGDYWPTGAGSTQLWNPREEPRDLHLTTREDGSCLALTPAGAFTIALLHLNRPQLLAWRLRKMRQEAGMRQLKRLQGLLQAWFELEGQRAEGLEDQRRILGEELKLLEELLRDQG